MPTPDCIGFDDQRGLKDDFVKNIEVLDLRFVDAVFAVITCAASISVFWLAASGHVAVVAALLMHLGVVTIPAVLVWHRLRGKGDLVFPVLLLVMTFAAGPLGALGSAFALLVLSWQNPTPLRLLDWYGYITGIVGRSRVAHIYDELTSGRLPDAAAGISRFAPILNGTAFEVQQRVLGVMGSRYHADFRHMLRLALRSRNGLIRAQAAAIAANLDLDEKAKLSTSEQEGGEARFHENGIRSGVTVPPVS